MADMCSYDDISDEEVSTCKERHSRLGEDNLNDTLEYDFGNEPCIEEHSEEEGNLNDTLEYDFGSEPYIEEQSEEEGNLNNTLEYLFGNEPCVEEKLEEQKTKDNCLMVDWNISLDAEIDFEEFIVLKGSVPPTRIPLPPTTLIQPHNSICKHSTSSSDLNKNATHIVTKNGSITDLKDNIL